MDVSVTSSATSPSEHGTHNLCPDHAVPPQAPAQTGRRAICPPTPPNWSALSRYATPFFPMATTTPTHESSVAPTEPRSESLASNACQFEGAKNERTCRSGVSSITELL